MICLNTTSEPKTGSKARKKGWVRILLGMVALLLALVAVFVIVVTVAEYKPADVETVAVQPGGTKELHIGDTFTILTLNTGFGALDDQHDMFTDGGVEGLNQNKDEIQANLSGMADIIADANAEIVFLQEVDFHSSRTFNVDQAALFSAGYGGSSAQALNYKAIFVPLPLKAPMGSIESGLQTMTQYGCEAATRISLPNTHKWPISACNLKRCILVMEIPLADSDKKLITVNVHLEAYASGEGKALQARILHDFVLEEYEKGNYVLVGGDFNQTIPGADISKYLGSQNDAVYSAPVIDTSSLPDGFRYVCDDRVPTCRFANSAYDPEDETTRFFVVDGFLVSPNIQVNSVETLDHAFRYTDHNPVQMNLTLLGV